MQDLDSQAGQSHRVAMQPGCNLKPWIQPPYNATGKLKFGIPDPGGDDGILSWWIQLGFLVSFEFARIFDFIH